MDKSDTRERKFAMRIDDLIFLILPRNDYNLVCVMLFYETMFFLCLFLPLSVEIIDTPKASPGELIFPVSKKRKMTKRSKNVKAGGKKNRATPLLDRPVVGALNIFEDAAAPVETPAARSPGGGNEELGLVALFGEGAANDALLDSSVDDQLPTPNQAPNTPTEATTPANSANESDQEDMEVDDSSAAVLPAAQPATGGPSGRMTAIIEAASTTSRNVALQAEVGVSTLGRRRAEIRRSAAKLEAKREERKRKSSATTSRDGEASTSREVAPKAKKVKARREPLQTGAFSDARSRLDAARGSDPRYIAERKGRLEAMRKGDTLVNIDVKSADCLPITTPKTPQKKLAATRKATPATPSAAPQPMATSSDPITPRPIRSSTPSSPLPSTSSTTSPAAAKGSSSLPRPSKRYVGKEPGVMGSDEVLQGRVASVYMRQLVDRGEIWKKENEEARKKLEALEKEIVATEKRVVVSQEQMDIAEEDWNLFFHGTREKPPKLQRAMKQAQENLAKGLPYTPWRSGPRPSSSGKGKGKGPVKGKGKGK